MWLSSRREGEVEAVARLIVRRDSSGIEEGMPSGAVLGSMGLHSAVLAFLFWGTTRIAIPAPPQVYQVELIAAPSPAPVRAVPVPERTELAPKVEEKPRPVETKPEPLPARRRETKPAGSEEKPAEEKAKPEVKERPAAAPEETRQGAQDLPVRLEGAPFPYPEYLGNIILQIKRHWRPPAGGGQLRAELAFTVLRDGSIEDVSWIRRSGNPAFDLEARGAIEAAGRRRAFGPLPRDYPADQLRVSFFFDPTRY